MGGNGDARPRIFNIYNEKNLFVEVPTLGSWCS